MPTLMEKLKALLSEEEKPETFTKEQVEKLKAEAVAAAKAEKPEVKAEVKAEEPEKKETVETFTKEQLDAQIAEAVANAKPEGSFTPTEQTPTTAETGIYTDEQLTPMSMEEVTKLYAEGKLDKTLEASFPG